MYQATMIAGVVDGQLAVATAADGSVSVHVTTGIGNRRFEIVLDAGQAARLAELLWTRLSGPDTHTADLPLPCALGVASA